MVHSKNLAASRNLAPGAGMNAERWQQVKLALDSVLALQSAQRPPYLEKLSFTDPELHREVESLLRSHAQAESSFLRDPAMAVLPGFETPRMARTGRRIGAYDILEEIGHGGMGEVYRAVRADGEFDREVAVKLVRSGFDSQFILERFRHERQILASLDHPNIARLLDGGTTDDGLPYLVMELVEGTPIDAHCEIHSLSIIQRLELFVPVCAAVHYAHQHLVIHRDLKPSNILVSPEGVPKLLDFGIAKILTPTGGLETTLMHALTPEYASPEQIRGQAVSTASDVYSLGVVLYQLLTGQTPYRGSAASAPDLGRAICEVEPARPSTAVGKPVGKSGKQPDSFAQAGEGSVLRLQRRLRGDLDNIVLRAMRKEPERRYASAEQFAEDVRRHLQGLPVSARQDSWSYRTGKFIRRHTAIVAATVIVILTLAVGMAVTLREKRIAERRFNDVRKLANSLIFEIDNSIADIPGSTAARKLLVGRALEYLDNLSREAKGDKSLQTELATAYERVGDVLGYPYAPNLGDSAGALASYRKALRIREALVASSPNEVKLQRQLAGSDFRIANALEFTGDLHGALDALRKTLPITEKLAAGKTDPELTDLFAGSHYFIAVLLSKTGDPSGALENYRQAAAIRQPVLQINPSNINLRAHLAGDYSGMAASLRALGDPVQAIAMQTQSIEILRELVHREPNSVSLREYLGEAVNKLSSFQRAQGKFADSLTTEREAKQIFRSLLAADSNNSLAKANVGFADNGIADALVQSGQPAAAIEVLQESVATFRAMSPETASNRYVRTGFASANYLMGNVYAALAASRRLSRAQASAEWREARSWYQKSLAMWVVKEKRGELESDERSEQQQVLTQITRCDAELHEPAQQGQH
jgi:non-specific serine/threonine protein kinase/serine/threonine-protein kinase